MSLPDDEPCLSCGACCASLRVSFHHSQLLSEGGYVPDVLANAETRTTWRMRGTDESPPRCMALEGSVGDAVRCSIYDCRPDPCREFAPHGLYGISNAECSRVRRRYGLSPLPAPEGLS
ncbi:MAG: zinc/iron-chelating domain-containing protein [Candidatus Dactylopiibacterium carminicum]|nr:MAG: zinc/iron-chelating domain-containing protein [Candidatus Dactylopiibacterium carminicum]